MATTPIDGKDREPTKGRRRTRRKRIGYFGELRRLPIFRGRFEQAAFALLALAILLAIGAAA